MSHTRKQPCLLVLTGLRLRVLWEISTTDFTGSNRTRRHCRHRRAPSRPIAGTGKTGNSTTSSMVIASIAERKVTALETAGARRKRVKKFGPADDRKEGGGSGRCYICGSEGAPYLRTGTGVCARALSTGRETVRSAELKRAQCWQN